MEIETYYSEIPQEIIETTRQIAVEVLGGLNNEVFEWKMQNHDDILLLLARKNGEAVGFKLGHRKGRTKFLSWIGGVKKEFRGSGCATKLMTAQADWCRLKGYRTIETQTMNKWKDMLILNLKNGFDIVGVFEDSELGQKIMLRKTL